MRAILWPLTVLILGTVAFANATEQASSSPVAENSLVAKNSPAAQNSPVAIKDPAAISSSAAKIESPTTSTSPGLPGLKPYHAIYQSKIKGFNVEMHRRLLIDGDTMSLSMKASKLMFAINEESVMLVDNKQLLPRRFIHMRKGLGDRHNKDLIFDWEKATVHNQLQAQQPALPLRPGTQDKLSYHALFRSQLLSAPRKPRYEFTVNDGKREKTYAFDFVAEEIIELPLGSVKAWKFKRDRGNSKRETYIWFAIDWDYLLVRVDQIERQGEKPETMLLRSAKLDGKKLSAR